MTSKDLELLRLLRINSRKSVSSISRECGMPVSSASDKIKKFEDGIIDRYASLLDFDALGMNGRIHMIGKIDPSIRNNFSDFLNKCPNVNSFFRLNGNFNFYVEAIFKSELESNDWVKDVKQKFDLSSPIVHHVLKDVQKEMFLVKK